MPVGPAHPQRALRRSVQHPGPGACQAAPVHRDREGRDRRLGRAGLDPGVAGLRPGDGPSRAAADEHPGLHDAGLRHQPADAGAGPPVDAGGRLHGPGAGHPPELSPDAARPRAPVRRRSAGVRRDLRERPGRRADQPPVPPRQLPQRPGGRDRRPQRAGARLVHLRRRRPHVPLRRQRQRAEDADPAHDPLGRRDRASLAPTPARRCCKILDTEISPELVPSTGPKTWAPRSRRSPPRRRSARTSSTTSRSTTPLATATRRRRWRSWPTRPGTTSSAAPGRRSPTSGGGSTTSRRSSRTWRSSSYPVLPLSQFKRSCIPNGPKVGSGGSLSPRGDYRAPSDGEATAWLNSCERSPTRPDPGAPFPREPFPASGSHRESNERGARPSRPCRASLTRCGRDGHTSTSSTSGLCQRLDGCVAEGCRGRLSRPQPSLNLSNKLSEHCLQIVNILRSIRDMVDATPR